MNSILKPEKIFEFLILKLPPALMFKKNVNEYSRDQYNLLVKNKKYMPSLFFELNENLELLRYFLYGNKWKHRIIGRYNHLLQGYRGKKTKVLLEDKIKSRIPKRTSIKTVEEYLQIAHRYFDSIANSSNQIELKKQL